MSMRKIYTLILLLFITVFPINSSSAYVVVTIPDMESLVEKLCECEVYSLQISDPHAYALTRKDVEMLSNAELIILSNSELLDFEKKIKERFKNVLDFEDYGIELEDHADFLKNPHAYWMKPENALAILKAVKDELSKIEPEKAEKYNKNYDFLEKTMLNFKDVARKIAKIESKKFIAFDSHVCYIVTSLGGEVSSVLFEEVAGVNVRILEEVKIDRDEIYGVVAPHFAKDLAEKLHERTGVKVFYVEVITIEDYFVKMIKNAASFQTVERKNGSDGSALLFLLLAICIAEAILIIYLRR